jgi:hypothetical protein
MDDRELARDLTVAILGTTKSIFSDVAAVKDTANLATRLYAEILSNLQSAKPPAQKLKVQSYH